MSKDTLDNMERMTLTEAIESVVDEYTILTGHEIQRLIDEMVAIALLYGARDEL